MGEEKFHFEGFDSPHYTVVPDALFDVLMPKLTDSELRVLLYIIRRTFGFKKTSDDISLRQLVSGITTKDGRVLDSGAGVSESSAVRAVRGLVEKGVVTATRNQSPEKGFEPTTFSLRWRVPPPFFHSDRRASRNLTDALLSPVQIQETVPQETERQETDLTYIRNAPSTAEMSGDGASVDKPVDNSKTNHDEVRQTILPYVEDWAREFGDTSPLKSSVTRAVNLYQKSGLPIEEFTKKLYEARAVTKESLARIKQDGTGKRKKMAYFFGCLENLLKQEGETGQG